MTNVDSCQGMPFGVPQTPHLTSAFRHCTNVDNPRKNVDPCSTVEERCFSAASSLTKDAAFSRRGRTFYPGALAAIVLLALAAHAQSPVAATLPPGATQQKATTACTECHEARIVLQQRLTKPAWTKEVDKMTKWGAVVDPADRDALIDYLSTNFSPDKPAYDPPRTAADKSSSGRSK